MHVLPPITPLIIASTEKKHSNCSFGNGNVHVDKVSETWYLIIRNDQMYKINSHLIKMLT